MNICPSFKSKEEERKTLLSFTPLLAQRMSSNFLPSVVNWTQKICHSLVFYLSELLELFKGTDCSRHQTKQNDRRGF